MCVCSLLRCGQSVLRKTVKPDDDDEGGGGGGDDERAQDFLVIKCSANAQLMGKIIRGDGKVSHQQLWPAKPSAELP